VTSDPWSAPDLRRWGRHGAADSVRADRDAQQADARIGARPLLIVGNVTAVDGMIWLSRITEHSSHASGIRQRCLAANSCGAENRGRFDTESREQSGQLVVEAVAELGGNGGRDSVTLPAFPENQRVISGLRR
jgi:hypothetical protein